MKTIKITYRYNFVLLLISLIFSVLLGLNGISFAAEDTWTRKSNMPTARGMLSTGVVKGKIYVIGGLLNFNVYFSTVEEYDPATDTWTKKADMPTARITDHSTCVVYGKIYTIGGENNGGLLSTVEEYDPETNKWRKRANMPTARANLGTCVVDGRIYVFGGDAGGGSACATVEEYNPATDKWTRKADMPFARMSSCAAAVNGKIYVIGGETGQWWQGPVISTVDEYNPVTDTWTKKENMPTARMVFSTSVVNGKIYAIGGHNRSRGLSTVEEYDPLTNTWTKKADIPMARGFLSSAAVNGRIYTVGGYLLGGGGADSTVEEYDTGFVPSQTNSVNATGKLPATWGEIKRNR